MDVYKWWEGTGFRKLHVEKRVFQTPPLPAPEKESKYAYHPDFKKLSIL
jgi:hypothetical protein